MIAAEDSFAERVHDFVEGLVDWVTGLSVADCVGIGLALAALLWIWASLRAMTRLGPVVIKPLEAEAGTKLPVNELTAMLRERLARGGLVPPPEVPGGAPKANVLSAIEASNVSQVALIGQIVGALPRPRPAEYTFSGTLFPEPPSADPGADQPEDADADTPEVADKGVRFWVRPSREGSELIETVRGQADYPDAVQCAADKTSLHIIESSANVLPLWVRWNALPAFQKYLDGLDKSLQGNEVQALVEFVAAAENEPANLLVRLKIANLQERHAGAVQDETARAVARADALEQYLRIAKMQPGLVEARYRASVLAGMLASTAETVVVTRQPMCDELTILGVGPGALAETLRELAELESTAVLQLLRPWYALLRETRLRHQLELKGFDRRQLRRTVLISRHCLRVRKRGLDTSLAARFELWWRHLVVRYRYMAFGGSWQAHYNAASFYALLYTRARALDDES
jgi:hypothetical protein